MSELEQLATYIFTWRTSRDVKVCQWCDPLDGQTIFYDLFSDVLVSDLAGPVWDLNADRSLMHGASGTCRCTLEVAVELDWSQIQELHELQDLLQQQGIHFPLTKEVFILSPVIAEARNQMRGLFAEMKEGLPVVTELNQLLTTYVSLVRRVGLPPEVMELVARAQQARIAVQTLHRSIMLLYTASGPIGWLVGLGGMGVSLFMTADFLEAELRGR